MKFPLIEIKSSAIVTAEITLDANNLILHYSIESAGNLLWPDFITIERKDGLWKSTCLELFISSPQESSYIELNLSPTGAWNGYAFSDYRIPHKAGPDIQLLELDLRGTGELSARFLVGELPDPALLGPSAITESAGGVLSYFATSHGEIPDFHNREHHVLVDLDHL